MTRPQILLVTHFYSSHRGGIELFAGKIANQLGKRGHRITWAASDTDAPPSGMEGVDFMPMVTNNLFEQKLGIPYPIWSRESVAKLKRAVRNSDVVHIHDSLYFGNVVAARSARSSGVPYVVTQHIGFVPYSNPILRYVLTMANKRVALPTLLGANCVSFVSETTRDYFRKLGLGASDGQVIPSGVDMDIFRPDGDADRAKFGITDDRPLCLFVGRFVEKKGLPMIRRLAEALPDVQWALTGWGPIDPETWGLPNVKVFRDLSGPTLAPLYRAADLFVLPSVGEGYPAVILESMACGTKAMVSTETAEGYPPAKPHLATADPDDPEKWIEKCSTILSDRNSLNANAQALVEFARIHWSWDVCVERYEDLILSAVSGATVELR